MVSPDTDDERIGEHCAQGIPGVAPESPPSAPSGIEWVNETQERYLSCATERHSAAIQRCTEIYRRLQMQFRGTSHMEAFKAKLRKEEEENGNPPGSRARRLRDDGCYRGGGREGKQ